MALAWRCLCSCQCICRRLRSEHRQGTADDSADSPGADRRRAHTLAQALPKPARLVLVRQGELQIDDHIFYVVPQPNPQNEQRVPPDCLLQLHVAVCDVGDKKAVLSRVRLEGLRRTQGETLILPDAPTWLDGDSGASIWQRTDAPPKSLVATSLRARSRRGIAIRFRTRRGIDWSERWTLEELRRIHDELQRPIRAAYGHMAWRRGEEIVLEPFEVGLSVQQQDLYVRTITEITKQFTQRPTIPQHSLPLE
jgi:hypothetical protein